jgi:hypothetical protein
MERREGWAAHKPASALQAPSLRLGVLLAMTVQFLVHDPYDLRHPGLAMLHPR